jgi:hypothetical protein
MLLHAFPLMSVCWLREFPGKCAYRHGGFNCFIKYLHRKLLTTNFSLMILKVLKNAHLLNLFIKTIIFLFSNYILDQFRPDRKWLYPFQWLKSRWSDVRWILLSNSSKGGPVGIFKCGSRKEKYLGSLTIWLGQRNDHK